MKALVISPDPEIKEDWISAEYDVIAAPNVNALSKDDLYEADVWILSRTDEGKIIERFGAISLPQFRIDVSVSPTSFTIGEDSFRDTKITGLWYRRQLFRWANKEQRLGHEGAYHLAFFDANDLKKTNDTLGHEAGDQLLKDIADSIEQACGEDRHIAVRWTGGDEFVALWQEGKTAREFVMLFEQKCRSLQVSASVGVADVADLNDLDSAIGKADESSYEDKKRKKKSRDQGNQPSWRQRILGGNLQSAPISERQDVNSPMLWVWSQDHDLQKSVEDVALAVSWALSENTVPVVIASARKAEWHQRLRVPLSMFTDAENGRTWHHNNGLWSAVITDTISSALFDAEDPKIIVAVGRDTPPPSDVVDINIVKDRVTLRKVMVTFAGKTAIPEAPYPAALAGRPDEQWLSWASDVVRPMLPGLHRFL